MSSLSTPLWWQLFVFGSASADATRSFVAVRYGPAGAPVAEAALGLAGDVGELALQARNLSVGGLVGRTAAETSATLAGGNAVPGAAGAAAYPGRAALLDAPHRA